ncbi:MAG: plasminogen-binding N-terminal domain-containing protein [Campylobacterales bacterium]|nr:plasminogen-binding N-terminal domain-containing protein [Campylobacterales bacterium]
MKYIIVLIFLFLGLSAGVIKTPIVSLDEENQTATISIDKIDIGMSGFAFHQIAPGHTSILKNVVVTDFDVESKTATLKLIEFNALRNNSLPSGKWKLAVGDTVELAFGYTRALLVAPSEEIYYRITKSVKVQWVHPDLFATVLSFRGHPTPLKEDFEAMSIASSSGLLFIYLDKKVYTVDMLSMKILSISDAPLTQDSVKLPFYSRVEEIDANWFGEGSDELEEYEPHYYELLAQNNTKNSELYKIIEAKPELHKLLDKFELEEK